MTGPFRIVPFPRRDAWNVAWRFVVVDGHGHTCERFDSEAEAVAFVVEQGGAYVVEPR